VGLFLFWLFLLLPWMFLLLPWMLPFVLAAFLCSVCVSCSVGSWSLAWFWIVGWFF